MKKLLLTVSFFTALQVCSGQPGTGNPRTAASLLERFDHIRSNLEVLNLRQTDNVDSASCIQLLKIAQELKNDSLLAISYNWIGSYFSFTKGDDVTGLEYYFKGIPLAEKAADKRRISSLYFDIAVAYSVLGNFQESFKNNLLGGENLPDRSSGLYDFMLAQYQRNSSLYYLSINEADSALHYAQLAAETAARVKTNNFLFTGLFLNGAAYALKADTAMADIYFQRAGKMSGTVYLNTLKSAFYARYIRFLFRTGRIKEAKTVALEFRDLGRKTNNNVMMVTAAGFLQEAFDSAHQTDSAYYYAKMKDRINAEIFSQNNINKMQALAFNEQVRKIEQEAKEREAGKQREENIQYALIALGIILFVILFLLLSRTVIVNERLISFFAILGLLVVFEFINLLIHPWLARVTHDSPVLMLIALVIIAAMLIPLHHRLERSIKEKMIRKNQSIRLAAAKRTIDRLEKKS